MFEVPSEFWDPAVNLFGKTHALPFADVVIPRTNLFVTGVIGESDSARQISLKVQLSKVSELTVSSRLNEYGIRSLDVGNNGIVRTVSHQRGGCAAWGEVEILYSKEEDEIQVPVAIHVTVVPTYCFSAHTTHRYSCITEMRHLWRKVAGVKILRSQYCNRQESFGREIDFVLSIGGFDINIHRRWGRAGLFLRTNVQWACKK